MHRAMAYARVEPEHVGWHAAPEPSSILGERDTIRGGEPDAHTVHSGRSFEFTIARLT